MGLGNDRDVLSSRVGNARLRGYDALLRSSQAAAGSPRLTAPTALVRLLALSMVEC